MLREKKRVVRRESGGESKIDFWRITAQALHMGLNRKEIGQMRLGDYMGLFDAYKEIHNMEVKKMLYVIPDRLDHPVSMLDL